LQFGATASVNAETDDPRKKVLELTAPTAPDYVFEAIGKTATTELIGPGGTTVVMGQVAEGETIRIDPYIPSEKEKVLRGSNYGLALDFPLMVELLLVVVA